jgi:hypothetical protein
MSCQTNQDNPNIKVPESVSSEGVKRMESKKGMANPVMLTEAGGVDIGKLINVYYRTGQHEKIYTHLDGKTKESSSKPKVLELLRKLDLGYDIKLSGAQNNDPYYLLTYTCQISQTKVIKQLRVVVENDTARIVPRDLLSGRIWD